ncbi:MAG: hypothetical protein DWP94_07970 [Flavobacterium sp.]|nr:MAG: hypothetical protein DWP94_07970 [Flavobacterium sp.]
MVKRSRKVNMKRISTLLFFTLITVSIGAQNKLIKNFDRHEIIKIVDDQLYSHNILGRNCKMIYSYKDKSFTIRCISDRNNAILYQLFNYVETKNNEVYVSLFGDGSNPISVYKVNDLIYESNSLEFVQSFVTPDGQRGIEIYRYYNIK